MGLIAVTETAELFRQKNISMTERDKEFVVQFAFRTNDRELTNKLIDELTETGADRDAVCRKYQTLTGFTPDWVQRIAQSESAQKKDSFHFRHTDIR